tara:strand:+ start:45 stop:425 length:381 start_codon:yes stop_codon:yes gene_type:complete
VYEDVKNALMRKLRLGNYGQARDFLKRGNRYCALGLLIETYREETGRGRWDGPHEGKNGVRDAYCYLIGKNEWSIELPSAAILKWAGMDETLARRLYALNDIERCSFAGIANFIQGVPSHATSKIR